jgi:sodium/bile acid cotransporter 7
MLKRFLVIFEPFILMLIGTVVLASLLPPRGGAVPLFGAFADIAIVLLFFLHGAKLSREAVVAGMSNWRLHLAVFASTYALFPLLGLGVAALPFLAPPVAMGMLFLTLLPSTVQSSIAFTAIARGNVAAAVCSASISNLLGIVVTPALTALLIHSSGSASVSLSSIESIVLQLLLPFVAGHLLRPWIGAFVTRQKKLLTVVDRGSILLVVYTAFGAAVVDGIWHRLSASEIGVLLAVCTLLLALVLLSTWGAGKLMGLSREDAIVLIFCGSKKSLVSGVPMAGVLFAPAQVGLVILPLMLFHQLQLIACAIIARRYADDPIA